MDSLASPCPPAASRAGDGDDREADLGTGAMSTGINVQRTRARTSSSRTPATTMRPAKRLDDQASSSDSEPPPLQGANIDPPGMGPGADTIETATSCQKISTKEMRDELTCSVCLDICTRPSTTACGHTFCRACLRQSLKHNRNCPKCRAPIPDGPLRVNTVIWNMVRMLFPESASASGPVTPEPCQPYESDPMIRAAPAGAARRHREPTGAFRPPWRHLLGTAGAADGRSATVADARVGRTRHRTLPDAQDTQQPDTAAADRSALLSTLLNGDGEALASTRPAVSGQVELYTQASQQPGASQAAPQSSRLDSMLRNPFIRRVQQQGDPGQVQRAPRAALARMSAPSPSVTSPQQSGGALPLMNPFARIRRGTQHSQVGAVPAGGRPALVHTAAAQQQQDATQPASNNNMCSPFVRVHSQPPSVGLSQRIRQLAMFSGGDPGRGSPAAHQAVSLPVPVQPAQQYTHRHTGASPRTRPEHQATSELVGASMLQDSDCDVDVCLPSPTIRMSRGRSLSGQLTGMRGVDTHTCLVPEDYQRRRRGLDTVTDQDDVLQRVSLTGVISRVPHSCAEDDTVRPGRDQLSLPVGSLGSGSSFTLRHSFSLRQSGSYIDTGTAFARDQPSAGALRTTASEPPTTILNNPFRQVQGSPTLCAPACTATYQPSPPSNSMRPASRLGRDEPCSPLDADQPVQGVVREECDLLLDLEEEEEDFAGLDLFSGSPFVTAELCHAPAPTAAPAAGAHPMLLVSPAAGTAARPIELISSSSDDEWDDDDDDGAGAGVMAVPAVPAVLQPPGTITRATHVSSTGAASSTAAFRGSVLNKPTSVEQHDAVRHKSHTSKVSQDSRGTTQLQPQQAVRQPLQAVSMNYAPGLHRPAGGQGSLQPDVKASADVVHSTSDVSSRDAGSIMARGHVSGLRPLRRSQRPAASNQ